MTADNKAKPGYFGNLLTLVLYFYFMSLWLAVPYFNWQYAQRHGFWSWIVLGEVVATAQAAAWPIYAFSGNGNPSFTAQERENLEHYHSSKDAANQANEIALNATNDGYQMTDQSEVITMITLRKRALDEANKVDLETLAKAHPDLPQHYKE